MTDSGINPTFTGVREGDTWRRDRRPHRLIMAVGIMVIIAGSYLVAYGVGVPGTMVYSHTGDDSMFAPKYPASPTVCFFVGLANMAAGLGMALGRWGLVIDKGGGKASRWYGLLGPWFKTEADLSRYRRVRIGWEVKSSTNRESGDEKRWTVFPVMLAGDKDLFHLDAPKKLPEARALADEIAVFLGWTVEDKSEVSEGRVGK